MVWFGLAGNVEEVAFKSSTGLLALRDLAAAYFTMADTCYVMPKATEEDARVNAELEADEEEAHVEAAEEAGTPAWVGDGWALDVAETNTTDGERSLSASTFCSACEKSARSRGAAGPE